MNASFRQCRQLDSIDVEERSEALKTLVQFRVKSAVDAIAQVARHDPEATIRSMAISSLGSINHESVFPSVLIGMADDSREVRAAAARSLNRLSFDRADAYVRVIETGDEETIRNVAKACIQAGIVSQNLDRLTNSDHRQAYETFSLISLLAKARMNEPVLDAIVSHPRNDVRLKAVHLLACTGYPETFEQLRELAELEDTPGAIKTAVLEAMYKLDQNKIESGNSQGDFVMNSVQPTTDFLYGETHEVTEGAFVVNPEDEVREGAFVVNPEDEVREGAFVVNTEDEVREGAFVVNSEIPATNEGAFFVYGELHLDDDVEPQPAEAYDEPPIETEFQQKVDEIES